MEAQELRERIEKLKSGKRLLEEDLRKETDRNVVGHSRLHGALFELTRILAWLLAIVIFIGCVWLSAASLAVKLQQLDFVSEDSASSWITTTKVLTFVAFLNQLANMADVDKLRIHQIYKFVFANEDGVLDWYVEENKQ